ncbi:hypothetical protein B296_00042186 [Ensete ventricosum]|uniref:Uncharacterized protein n=1 Tax=Ensete ventricosum TaxID=4639 RepID=A0A426ZGK5_ENSVE|nr:hypothetical protein B296_00042186 [Ensete ventricosum]
MRAMTMGFFFLGSIIARSLTILECSTKNIVREEQVPNASYTKEVDSKSKDKGEGIVKATSESTRIE